MKDFNGFPKRLETALYNKTNKTALAETLGVTRSTVKSWTNGKSSPTAEFLARLCVELEVSGDWLLFGEYRIDIFRDRADTTYEAWLYNPKYGTKNLMFGCEEETLDSFLELVEANADEYIALYISDVEDGELISLVEWAELNGITPETARQRAQRGAFETAVKIGRNWLISSTEPLIDHRKKPVD